MLGAKSNKGRIRMQRRILCASLVALSAAAAPSRRSQRASAAGLEDRRHLRQGERAGTVRRLRGPRPQGRERELALRPRSDQAGLPGAGEIAARSELAPAVGMHRRRDHQGSGQGRRANGQDAGRAGAAAQAAARRLLAAPPPADPAPTAALHRRRLRRLQRRRRRNRRSSSMTELLGSRTPSRSRDCDKVEQVEVVNAQLTTGPYLFSLKYCRFVLGRKTNWKEREKRHG